MPTNSVRQMDDSETLAEAYLRSLGYADVRYEPNGNIPPDFLVDGRIAVEVRRLNQHHVRGAGEKIRSLEETSIPLQNKIANYLRTISPSTPNNESWFVSFRFRRPVPNWRYLEKELNNILRTFMVMKDRRPFQRHLTVGNGFEIRVFGPAIMQNVSATGQKSHFFRLAGCNDSDSGGWAVSEIAVNLAHCIAEKLAKIASRRATSREWWLVLPDHMGFFRLDEADRHQVRCHIAERASDKPREFDRVILLKPFSPVSSDHPISAFQVHP